MASRRKPRVHNVAPSGDNDSAAPPAAAAMAALSAIPGFEPTQRYTAAQHNALPPGTQINDYEIVRVLGEGGFSIVYLAEDRTLERRVAIKEYLPVSLAVRGEGAEVTLRTGSQAETFAQGLVSFINEARLLARFDHPSLVRVHHFWKANGTAYMVMPYLEGSTLLATRRAMAGPPDEPWLRELLSALLGALDVLHEASCFHRDIAPDNILILHDGKPLLLDFGAARHVIGERTQQLTAILKPAFAPIEQYAEAAHLQQGPWTDLYALGAVARFCVTGNAPPPSTVRAMHDDMEALANEVRTLSRDYEGLHYSAPLLAAIDWALAVRPADRPQNVEQFRQALILPHVVPTVRAPAAPAAAAPAETPAAAPHASSAAPAAQPQDFAADDFTAEESEEERAEAAIKRLLESVDAPAKGAATAPPEEPWTASRPAEVKRKRQPQHSLRQAVLFGVAATSVGALGAAAWLWNVEQQRANELVAAVALDPRAGTVLSPASPPALPAQAAAPTAAPTPPVIAPSAAPVQPAAAPVQPVATSTVTPPALERAPGAAPAPAGTTRAEVLSQGGTTTSTGDARASPGTTSRVTDATGVRASTRARSAPPAEPDNPRAVCAPRQQFALYYCMQTQCQSTRYYAHPQCVDLRRRDEVD
jgi:serine/threonine protein kinase